MNYFLHYQLDDGRSTHLLVLEYFLVPLMPNIVDTACKGYSIDFSISALAIELSYNPGLALVNLVLHDFALSLSVNWVLENREVLRSLVP